MAGAEEEVAAGVDSARKLLALAAALVAALAWSSTAAQSKTEFKDYLLGPATPRLGAECRAGLAAYLNKKPAPWVK